MQEVLEAAAITVVITQGTIFRPLRERGPKLWRELVSCPLCLGWWIGAFAGWLEPGSGRVIRVFFGSHVVADLPLTAWHVVASGALAGSAALLFRRLTDWLDSNS